MKSKEFRRLARENLNGRWGNFALITFLYMLFVWLIGMASNSIPIIGPIAIYIISPVMSFGFINQMILLKNGVNVDCLDFLTFGFKKFADVWKIFGWLMLKYLGPIIMFFVAIMLMTGGIVANTIFSITSYNTNQVTTITPEMLSTPEVFVENQMQMTVGRTAEIISFMIILLSLALCIGATIWLIPLSYKYAFAYYELAMSPGMSPKDIVELSGRKMIGNRWKYFKLTLSFIGWYLLACLGLGIPLFWITPYMTIASVFFYVWVSQEYQNNGTINY